MTDTPDPKEKLTLDLKPGEFIELRGEKQLILDCIPREAHVELFITRADIDAGEVLIVRLPIAWITTIEHQEMPHHAAMMPG